MNTRIISIVNHKGGVGKTTTALNVGVALAKYHKKKTLLIDIDPQGNLSTSLGFKLTGDENIYRALIGSLTALPVQQSAEEVDVVTSSLDLVTAERQLMGEAGSEHVLAELLEPIRNQYDYILIDCPPSLGTLTFNALTASTDVFIVAQAQFLALQGVGQLLYTIDKIKNRINKGLELSGVVITQFQKNLILSQQVENTLVEQFPEIVFDTKIRVNTALAESVSESESIFAWDDKSNGAIDYKNLADEIIARFK